MRTDPRYTRVRDMLLDDAVPRLASSGIALCHICQRSVYFAGGFIQVLVKNIESLSLRQNPGRCPRCGSAKNYLIRRYCHFRCSKCRHQWSGNQGTVKERPKKPRSWYDKITELHRQGINPHRISKIIGAKDNKGVYQFVKRLQVFDAMMASLTTERTNV